MFSKFLDLNTTYSTELRDFSEWHKGIKYFGFWAIEVSLPSCHDKIKTYKEHLSHRLHPNYLRQAHITMISSGLLSDKYFHQDLLNKQVRRIKKANIKSFSLHLCECNSFATCPYLSIYDPLNKLDLIREHLICISQEDSPKDYTPHVTLGFYNKAYNTSDIVKDMSFISLADIEFTVNELI